MVCDDFQIDQWIQDISPSDRPHTWGTVSDEDTSEDKNAGQPIEISAIFGKVKMLDGLKCYDGNLLLLDQWLSEVEQHLKIRNLPIYGGYFSGNSSDGTIRSCLSTTCGSEASWSFMLYQLREVTEKLTGTAKDWYERYCHDGFMPPNCWRKNEDNDYAGEVGLYQLLTIHFRSIQDENLSAKPFCDLKLPTLDFLDGELTTIYPTGPLFEKESPSQEFLKGKIQSLIRCNNCWGYGHLARKCPSPLTLNSLAYKEPIRYAVPAHFQSPAPDTFTPPTTPLLSPLYQTNQQNCIHQVEHFSPGKDVSTFPFTAVPPVRLPRPQMLQGFRSQVRLTTDLAAVRHSRSVREDKILESTCLYLLQGKITFPPELNHAIKDFIQFRGLRVQGDVVMDRKNRIVVSSSAEREKIYLDFHRSSGHQYISGTMTTIAENYWWPCFAHFVQSRISYCQECLKYARPLNTANTVAFPTLPSHIFERWMVVVSPLLKTTSGGNRYLVIAVEISTRWIEAIPVQNKEPITVASRLYKIFEKFGAAKFLQSDHGAVFINAVIDELNILSNGHLHIFTPYHPRTRGWIEKINTFGFVNKLTKESQTQWDEAPLELALITQRSSLDPATGESPLWLVWGHLSCFQRIQAAFALNIQTKNITSSGQGVNC